MSNLALGFIGLGNLGAPMARRLTGWPGGLTVFDVRADAATALAQEGATVADSVAEVAAADVISIAVVNDEQVRGIVDALAPHAKPGTVIAIHSTIGDQTTPELADRWAPRGIHLVDAPVSGSSGGARQGALAVMVGAERDVFQRVKPVFEKFGSLVIHAGGPGAGTRMKLARNMVIYIAYAGVGEALRLAEAGGIDLLQLGEVIRHTDALTGGPGVIVMRGDTAPLDADHDLHDIFAHTRDLGEKDLGLALALGTDLGVDLPMSTAALKNLGTGLGVPRTDSRDGGVLDG
ncbi:NAD(P)-dependent oxidoreductase [Mycobacterium sp. MBM]|nr:NAD(P)-dependent oxidoreductase [Mycobacterium sp. MBM]